MAVQVWYFHQKPAVIFQQVSAQRLQVSYRFRQVLQHMRQADQVETPGGGLLVCELSPESVKRGGYLQPC